MFKLEVKGYKLIMNCSLVRLYLLVVIVEDVEKCINAEARG